MLKRVVPILACLLFVLAVAAMATETPGSLQTEPPSPFQTSPAVCPALSTPEPPVLSPAKLPDPLAGVRFASCATCIQANYECKNICGGKFVCIVFFYCPPEDPCGYTCDCTETCPPE